MAEMGYHWQTEPKGQYADGHECEDVVDQCQKVYLPFMAKCEKRTREWDNEGKGIVGIRMWEGECYTIIWVHEAETTKPYAKGEGQSFMVAHFVSADYSWLCSVDGTKHAHVDLKPGKN